MVITIREYKNRGIYDAYLGDECLCCASRVPIFTAAYLLLERGADPDERLEVWREGRSAFDIATKVSVGARLTVETGRTGVPHFVALHNHQRARTAILRAAE